jgi:penicillin amidase
MRADAAAPSLFSTFYRRLFYAVFEDEMGPEVARGYRLKANLSAVMMRAVLERGPERWFDRVDTAPVEDRQAIVRATFRDAVDELAHRLGGRPAGWAWGRLHTLELVHPVGGASPLLARYFNRGPFPVPGHNSTVNKMEFDEADFRVRHGPSVRRITDFADLEGALSVLPGGQSGIPASPHYDDQTALWLAGGYHPLPMDRARVEAVAEARLRLEPRR